MGKPVIAVFVTVCLAGAVRADYDCNVSLWRGESLSTLLPDEASHVSGSAPDISVERGTLMPVRYLDLWQHPWAVSRVNGVKPFSAEHYRAMEPLWRQLAAAGQKTLTVTLLNRPWNRQCHDAYESMIVRRKGADGTWSGTFRLIGEITK